MNYTASFAHNSSDNPGQIKLDAATDPEAIAELRKFVSDGYRNQTWASVDLSDGRTATVRNAHGKAVVRHTA